MSLIGSVDITLGSSPGCLLDLSAFVDISICPSIDITIHGKPHRVVNKPETICVTPTAPKTTTSTTCTSKAHSPTTTKANMPSNPPPTSPHQGGPPKDYCDKDAIGILVDLKVLLDLGLLADVDIEAYVKILGLDLGVVGDLLHKILKRDPAIEAAAEKAPSQLIGRNVGNQIAKRAQKLAPENHTFKPACGKKFKREGTRHNAVDHNDCLLKCEAEAIRRTVADGDIKICAAVTIDYLLDVDACLVILGKSGELVDLHLNVDLDVDLLDDSNCDSFYR